MDLCLRPLLSLLRSGDMSGHESMVAHCSGLGDLITAVHACMCVRVHAQTLCMLGHIVVTNSAI